MLSLPGSASKFLEPNEAPRLLVWDFALHSIMEICCPLLRFEFGIPRSIPTAGRAWIEPRWSSANSKLGLIALQQPAADVPGGCSGELQPRTQRDTE